MNRIESDTLGTIEVPSHCYYGAQTQRSLENFPIGTDRMPTQVIQAMVIIKKASAIINHELGKLDKTKSDLICEVCDEVLGYNEQAIQTHFPLVVWQTGSGTQTNMNVNEVISNRCIEKCGGVMGSKDPIHPNDHVNMSQSSNDTFPTAMHIAAVLELDTLLKSCVTLRKCFETKVGEFKDIVKVGRTHLMDATPITLGQEFSGYVSQLLHCELSLESKKSHLLELALGGTAVGTGLNTHPEYAVRVASCISTLTGHTFVTAPNKFEALSGNEAVVACSGGVKQLAVAMNKIANDIRWSGSGPRCGIGELMLPANEPGSSIMPGKVNPTQCEAMTMVCAQVMGNDMAIAMGGAQGNFQLNVFKPLMIFNLLHSMRLLSDACDSFGKRCVMGLGVNQQVVRTNVERTLMLATALNAHVGYDTAAKIVKKAYNEDKSLREAALELKVIDAQSLDRILDPNKMV